MSTANQAAGDQAFGGTSWRKVRDLPSDMKKRFLVGTYRESLQVAGFPYVLFFEMLGVGGHDLHLVYGTTNSVGQEKMKEAMFGQLREFWRPCIARLRQPSPSEISWSVAW